MKCSVSKDMSGTKYSAGRDFSVPNIRPGRTYQYNIFGDVARGQGVKS
jgi:hypothetical protein